MLLQLLKLLLGIYLLGIIGLYFIQEKLLFFPTKLPKDYRFHFPYAFEEINLSVEKDVQLNMLLFKAEKPKGVVLFFHGNAGAIHDWGYGADLYLENNYDILYVDYRGYGKSGGTIKSEQQLLEDAQNVYEKLKEKYGEENIIVSGTSIGSGIAAKIAVNNKPKQLILNAPYSSLKVLIKEKVPLVPGFIIRYKLATKDIIKEIDCPIVIFHGNQDQVIPYQHALRLKELNPLIKLYILDAYAHNNISQSPEFITKMRLILN